MTNYYLYEILEFTKVKVLFESIVSDCIKDTEYERVKFKYNFKHYLSGRIKIKLYRSASSYSALLISEFPSNCGWIIVHNLPVIEPNLVIKISTEICKKFKYAGFFISDNIKSMNYSEYAKVGRDVLMVDNPHSGNRIGLLYFPTGEKE